MKNSPTSSEIQDTIIAYTAEVIDRELLPGSTNATKNFTSLGVDSVSVFQLQMKLENYYSLALPNDFLFEHSTAEEASSAILQMLEASLPTASSSEVNRNT